MTQTCLIMPYKKYSYFLHFNKISSYLKELYFSLHRKQILPRSRSHSLIQVAHTLQAPFSLA